MEIQIQRLLKTYKKATKQDFIEMIKLRGKLIEHTDNVFPLLNDKFGERAVLQFNGLFYVTFIISGNFVEILYGDDVKVYDSENEARECYHDLPNILNDEENE